MNVHFTYKHTKNPELEVLINQQLEKLRKRLQVFKPDMVSLHGSVENGSRSGASVSLNLRLPSGQMAARSNSENAATAIRASFDDLLQQLSKHKAQLRAEHHWPRQRSVVKNPISQVPFEDTVAAVRPERVSQKDITSYVDADFGKLRRFVDRELNHLIASGQLRPGQLSTEEVIDEAIASALDDSTERPEKLALEPWLYRMSREAIARLSRDTTREDMVSIDSEDQAADEVEEPEEGADAVVHRHTAEVTPIDNMIADQQDDTPEERVATDEIVGMVDVALRNARPEDREAFILFVFEGFTLDEIAAITDSSKESIRQAIGRAREQVRNGLPVKDNLKTSILDRAEIA